MRKMEIMALLAIAAVVVLANIGLKNFMDPDKSSKQQVEASEGDKSMIAVASDVLDAITPTPDSLNVLLIGLDKSKALADINIVVHLDTETNKMQLISLPRDLFIDFRSEQFKDIKAQNSKIKVSYCKLTEVYSNAGHNDQALQDMKAVAEVITGLTIDNVAAVDTNGFVEIVDILGGVDFEVPQNMYYNDPYQNLHIDLKAGMQHLDGDKAEQLVRFRKYKGSTPPDKQRMKVQQDFLKELSKKVLEIRSFGQVNQLISKGYEILKTDIGLLTILEYAEYTLNQDVKELLAAGDMIIIPSVGERMGEQNLWYEKWDAQEARTVVKELIEN